MVFRWWVAAVVCLSVAATSAEEEQSRRKLVVAPRRGRPQQPAEQRGRGRRRAPRDAPGTPGITSAHWDALKPKMMRDGEGNTLRCNSQGDLPTECPVGADFFSRDELKEAVDEFAQVYKRRPIGRNFHGVAMNHAFSMWFLVKKLKPPVIVESGVYKGQGTWLLREAAGPETRIYCLDPRDPDKMLAPGFGWRDSSEKTTYLMGDAFADFGAVDFDKLFLKGNHTEEDRAATLVILDDHMSSTKRVTQALRARFRHLWFDDNWKYAKSDNYSPNVVCSPVFKPGRGEKIVETSPTAVVDYRDNFGSFKVSIPLSQHQANLAFAKKHIVNYFEFPPLFDSCLWEEQRRAKDLDANGPSSESSRRANLLNVTEAAQLLATTGGGLGPFQSSEFITFFPPYVQLDPEAFQETNSVGTTPFILQAQHISASKVTGVGLMLPKSRRKAEAISVA